MDREYTANEKVLELKRELGFRIYVYPKSIAAGKMDSHQAEYQIGILKAMINDYEEQIQPSLFKQDN